MQGRHRHAVSPLRHPRRADRGGVWQEVDALVAAASEFEANATPVEAPRAWLNLFIDFLETKQGIVSVLDTLIGRSDPLYSGTPARLSPPVDLLVKRANAGRGIRIDMVPLDLLRAMAGIARTGRGRRGSSRPAPWSTCC